MQSLVYRRSVIRYLLTRVCAGVRPRHFWGRLAPLRLEERRCNVPEGWVRLRVRLCGICGSDIDLLRAGDSFLMEPYASFPAVLGHECVAEVLDASGSEVVPAAGQRVVVQPLLPCALRGVGPCRFCAEGREPLCEEATGGTLAPGALMGYHSQIGGGFAEEMAVHPRQLVTVPDRVPDAAAVLTDSLACALQPALDHFPGADGTVVVFGAGIIGQHLVRVLRAFGCAARIIVIARYAFQERLARLGGADEVLLRPTRRNMADALGARWLDTSLGGGVMEGGAAQVFDCVGSATSLQEGLLMLRARGKLVMIGGAGHIANVDLSRLWFRELTVIGSNCCSQTTWQGETVRTYQRAMDLLADGYPSDGLVTHTLPLNSYRQAFQVAMDKKANRSMKVALGPPAQGQ